MVTKKEKTCKELALQLDICNEILEVLKDKKTVIQMELHELQKKHPKT